MSASASAIFVLAPRYARDVAAALHGSQLACEIVTRPAEAAAAFEGSPARVALIDLRGALAVAAIAAHEVGAGVEARHGAMLVLVARGDAGAVPAARAAGATHILASPFTATELRAAVDLAFAVAGRLDGVASGRLATRGDARRDVLTGLATAEHAHAWLELLLGESSRHEPGAIVMLVAVGRFGQVNTAYGPQVADALLQSVAGRLSRDVVDDHGDAAGARLVARMAGAEFAVVLPAPVTPVEALQLAQRIVASMDVPFAADGRVVHLGVRIGIASADAALQAEPEAAAAVFRRARAVLARARAGAPGGIEIFTTADTEALSRLADLEVDLRNAIDRDEFGIVFQPQVALDTGHIRGVEALVRWKHPQYGELPAETLLEVAASAEFATQLGAYIRDKALHEAAAWPAALDALNLSVNVTAGDLCDNDFTRRLDATLASSGFSRGRLTLEITESDLIQNLDAAAGLLTDIRARGSSIALDDFGTGYSSLSYLKSLPLDCLKLDKRLTADLAGRARDRIIVRGIVDMARALGLRVVAEGVETADDLDLVVDARCDWYQGFLCSPALPGSELAAFVTRWDARAGA